MFSKIKNSYRLFYHLAFLFVIILLTNCRETTSINDEEYPYESIKGDPLSARIYTLDNGLKVYMTVYKDAPRIQTAIAIKVGSKNDPPDTTGLAHYLEHLLFKGTDEFGTIDYEKEKEEINKVVNLFERYRQTSDSLARKAIYQQIDSISYEASKYAIANEYDKMLSAIGARGTNAFTGNDQTVYINDIPSNQLEKWLTIEVERLADPVMRLFHTELEVVYEEKNRSLDNDRDKVEEALNAGLFQKHPYGTQTTLGKIEHLKNPSMKKVAEYFHTYYVPNNMAICLSGDFDHDSLIRMIDAKFGKLKPRKVPVHSSPAEDPITAPIIEEVWGPDMESVTIGFRLPGVKSKEAEMLRLTDYMLMNSVAGLIDLNLKQKQKVIEPYSYADIMRDYSIHVLAARPRVGQELKEVKDLLLSQLELIKKGEFPEWLPGAVVNDLKLQRIKGYESNWGRMFSFVNAFIYDIPWEDYVNRYDRLAKMTKDDVVNFANKYYGDNFVVVYKRTGEDKYVKKIAKPAITPIELNRQAQSDFVKHISSMKSPDIQPVFIDFDRDMARFTTKNGIPIHYKQNTENDLFRLYYITDMGTNHDRKLGVAIDYLPYLGTSKYSPEEFQQELYKIGCSFDVFTSEDQVHVSLSGLNENYSAGLKLFEHLLSDALPYQAALENLVKDILKDRADSKLSKWRILGRAMYNYGIYGKTSPFTNILSGQELYDLEPGELTEIIKNINSYEHRILYYGPYDKNALISSLNKYHSAPEKLRSIPEPKMFEQLAATKNQAYVVNYDMKQAEIILLSKSVPYSRNNIAIRNLFNEYYGNSMASVVFQIMRESKALAYSVYGSYSTPSKKDKAHYIFAYIGTQADKLPEAMDGMFDLLNNMPASEISFKDSKDAIITRIKSERITKSDILFRYESAMKLGNEDRDLRRDVYEQIPSLEIADLRNFFDQYIKNKKYTILVLGDIEKLDLTALEKYGDVKKLTLEEVFCY